MHNNDSDRQPRQAAKALVESNPSRAPRVFLELRRSSADTPDMALEMLSPDEQSMVRAWFGYGRWDAPYWFVGIEPGGDELEECARLWQRLDKAELLDIAAHHEEHSRNWFGADATPQRTWQKLIWLLKTYQGLDPSPEATLEY